MYIGPGQIGASPGLRLANAAAWTFDESKPFSERDHTYFRDLWQLFGLNWDSAMLDGTRNTYTDMLSFAVSKLLTETGPIGLDVAILANSVPDSEPGYPMPYLEQLFDEIGTAFGLSDQGGSGPFTALRIAGNAIMGGRNRRALVAIADQRTILTGTHVPDDIRPVHDTAVLLLLTADGGFGAPQVRQRAGVAGEDVAALLRAELGDEPATVICRPPLAGHLDGLPIEVRPAADGRPATGLWMTLAEYVARWDGVSPHRVFVVDHDPAFGYVNSCRLELGVTS